MHATIDIEPFGKEGSADHTSKITLATTHPVTVRRTRPITTPRAIFARFIDPRTCAQSRGPGRTSHRSAESFELGRQGLKETWRCTDRARGRTSAASSARHSSLQLRQPVAAQSAYRPLTWFACPLPPRPWGVKDAASKRPGLSPKGPLPKGCWMDGLGLLKARTRDSMTSTKSLLARALFVRHWRRCRHERHHQAIRQG